MLLAAIAGRDNENEMLMVQLLKAKRKERKKVYFRQFFFLHTRNTKTFLFHA